MEVSMDDAYRLPTAGDRTIAGVQDSALAAEMAGNTRDAFEVVLFETKRVIVGQDAMVERLLVALLTGGHVLLEGVPGLAKTLTVSTLARVLSGSFARVQFTPDLVPSDIVGTRVYRPQDGEFDVELGPVFTNLLLADEINRAPAKVQSALLEVMQERQVTIAGRSHPVPDPFLVLATQNPIENEGTYPLPEAQLDRFLLKIVVGHLEPTEETVVLSRSLAPAADVRPMLTIEDLRAFQRITREVYVDPRICAYVVDLVNATRTPAEHPGLDQLAPYITHGASPRGALGLVHAARALALLRGRGYVVGRDIADLAHDVLRHRIVLSYDALADGVSADDLLDGVLDVMRPPQIELTPAGAAA
jgi:MoxR-like ATPase